MVNQSIRKISLCLLRKGGDPSAGSPTDTLLRLHSSQWFHLRTPLEAKGTSGASTFRSVTGGEYKTQEHIHRDIADSRLLAIPTSWGRVAALNSNLDQL